MTQVQFAIDNLDVLHLRSQYEGGQKLADLYEKITGKIMRDPQRLIRRLALEGYVLRYEVDGETIQVLSLIHI